VKNKVLLHVNLNTVRTLSMQTRKQFLSKPTDHSSYVTSVN